MKAASVKIGFLLAMAVLMQACALFKTAIYDQHTYQQTIELKVESIALMKKAAEPYSDHRGETEVLLKEMEKMMEYEKHKENNNITYKMWKLLCDEEKNLFGGFVKRWKAQGTLSKPFIGEAAKQVEEAYDLLIRYESKKDKKAKAGIQNYVN